ncbi:MAG: chromosome segregation protein SMC [Syntrophomonadaceae bacterium]|nr:chromosome segregation protein SMC [Syntrophomonadaceae bacterium]
MYLKHLEMKGFKSFAKGIEIDFRPGINVIVGPNGCGKSNIADAIRWVLGEANVRNLRGQRGEDVIFTGTDKKKPLGMAWVSMTVDNQDRVISNDYSEISVARRIYRNGESEFLLNMNQVRLKDIHSLFAGTGLGKRGYSIIGQGELEQVLDAKPFERRLLMEEAAEISGFRYKKEEAENRMNSSALDLIRLEDIIGEVSQRVAELEIKGAQAQKYLELTEALGFRERKVMAFELMGLQREADVRQREVTELGQQLAVVRDLFHKEELAFQNLTSRQSKARDTIAFHREEKYKLTAVINRIEGEHRLAEERINNARERLDQMEKDISKHRELMQKIDSDLELSTHDLAAKETELKGKTEEAEKILTEIQATEVLENNDRVVLAKLEGREVDMIREESLLAEQAQRLEAELKKLREKLEQSQNESFYLMDKMKGERENLTALRNTIRNGQKSLDELMEKKRAVESKRELAQGSIKELIDKSNRARTELEEINRRILHLEENIRSHAGLSEGVRNLVTAVSKDNRLVPGLIGVVADLLEVPSGLETAVEAAVGGALENVVVQREEDASKAIALLKKKSWGRVTLLPLNILHPSGTERRQVEAILKVPGVVGLGVDLVGFDPEHRKAVEYVLGRILIVEDLQIGLKVFRQHLGLRIVTVEGDIINPAGAMTGGRNNRRGPTPLQMKVNYRESVSLATAVTAELETLISDLEMQKSILEELDADWNTVMLQVNEKTFQHELLVKEEARTVQFLDDSTRKIKAFNSEEDRLLKDIAGQEGDLERVAVGLKGMKEQLDNIRGDKHETEASINQNNRMLDLLRERHAHCCDLVDLRMRELEARRNNLNQQIAVKESYDRTLTEYESQIKKFDVMALVEQERIESLEEEKDETQQKLSDIKEIILDIEGSLNEGNRRHLEAQANVESLRGQIAALEGRITNGEMKKLRADMEEKNLQDQWTEKFGDEPFCDYLEEMDKRRQKIMRDEAVNIKESLGELGPVDLTSIDELSQTRERYDFLQEQMEDLQQAREALSSIIEETELIMNQRFQEFLRLANGSFNKTFNTIFEGGEAELLMENHENPLQAGVDIMVKMPGKRRQSLNLLSGGERALTCIAFIFSLLALKPTPFCLIDEIDAALDEANLGRFTGFLRKLAETIQFVVITHRQGTIEIGDNIYGVTMPEQGMSEVFSITPREAEELAG